MLSDGVGRCPEQPSLASVMRRSRRLRGRARTQAMRYIGPRRDVDAPARRRRDCPVARAARGRAGEGPLRGADAARPLCPCAMLVDRVSANRRDRDAVLCVDHGARRRRPARSCRPTRQRESARLIAAPLLLGTQTAICASSTCCLRPRRAHDPPLRRRAGRSRSTACRGARRRRARGRRRRGSPAGRRRGAARPGRRRGSRDDCSTGGAPTGARKRARAGRASPGRARRRAGSAARVRAAAASTPPGSSACAAQARPARSRSKNITAAGLSGGRPLSA